MSDARAEIEADLAAQGLDGVVTSEDVEASFGLFESDPNFDPNFAYDPTAGPPEVYAPTASEMEPDNAPEGWPNG
jgi:hypothetical protein